MLSRFVADEILKFDCYFSEKIRLDISCELSARQMIHMKYQALSSLKKTTTQKQNKNNFKVSSAVVVISALRLKD